MSRTYKTRPSWVQNNDPKGTPYKVYHTHSVVLSEVIGEEEYEPYWDKGTTRIRPLYRRWIEQIDCTADVLEESPSSWRFRRPRTQTNEDKLADKHCYKYPLWYAENWRSKREMKNLTNRALRTKINQQLTRAVKDNGHCADIDAVVFVADGFDDEGTIWKAVPYTNWLDIDIHTDSKYASTGWWD